MKKIFVSLFIALVLAFSVSPVMQAATTSDNPSPTATSGYTIVIHNNKGGSGSYTVKKSADGKHYIITATAKKGYKFKYWIIDGKYVLVDGDLKSNPLTIDINSDVEATPVFEKIGSSSSSSSSKSSSSSYVTPISRNSGSVSPKTGSTTPNEIFYIIGAFGVLAVIVTALGVKLVKNQK